jgi:tripartite ATP-independent transporter DctM subunit
MAILPVLEIGARTLFDAGVPGAYGYVQNLTLWVGFLGAMIASRNGVHLGFANTKLDLPKRLSTVASVFSATAATAVAAGLTWAAFRFLQSEMVSSELVAGWLPIWVVEAILPLGFAVMTIRFTLNAGGWWERLTASLGIPGAVIVGFLLEPYAAQMIWPGIAALVIAALMGAPIFVVMGGAALLLFFAENVPVAAMTVETYRIAVSPLIPTIPLFTLTGYLLAEGGASHRLIRLFRALFGWMPGGLAIVTTLVCAFFTTFTGGSGVTILALGGLLLPILLKSGYGERFSLGLVTATGSIGLLFPPSLAVILYGVVAHVPIPDLFVAALLPGALMVLAVCLLGFREGLRGRVPRPAFDPREAFHALWEAKWELLFPFIVLFGIFGGLTTLIEAAALTVIYALIVECAIHRDLHIGKEVPKVLIECATLFGGVFVILGVAMGLTNFLVDAEVPMKAAAWARENIDSRLVFLLALNLFLLLVGCLMDIYAAIVVVVPLIVPIGEVFAIHPLHLAMIFLVNLELGYLTPPVGMNLFLAAYRFERPLVQIYRSGLPFLLLLMIVVLLITYIPELIIGADDGNVFGTQ